MKREAKLIKKVKRLLKRLGSPRYLHHFGPKTYEFKEHLRALLMKSFCQLSYRRIAKLFDLFGIRCPSKSALQYTAEKLDSAFWSRILKLTSGDSYIVAIDSTGLSRTNPSYHYLRRINGKPPKVYAKLSVAFDTRKKKFCAARVRVLPAHDVKDAPFLIKKSMAKIVVADKAYNSEKLFQQADKLGMVLMSPKRKNVKKGYCRRKMQKLFRTRTYNRRQLGESGFGSVKRKFGASVSSKTARTIRSEVYGRLACHNLFGSFIES